MVLEIIEAPKPLFYTRGRSIYQRPVETKHGNGTTSSTMGFLVCVVEEFVDPIEVCRMLNVGSQN